MKIIIMSYTSIWYYIFVSNLLVIIMIIYYASITLYNSNWIPSPGWTGDLLEDFFDGLDILGVVCAGCAMAEAHAKDLKHKLNC